VHAEFPLTLTLSPTGGEGSLRRGSASPLQRSEENYREHGVPAPSPPVGERDGVRGKCSWAVSQRICARCAPSGQLILDKASPGVLSFGECSRTFAR
jgi:hypothetical protein